MCFSSKEKGVLMCNVQLCWTFRRVSVMFLNFVDTIVLDSDTCAGCGGQPVIHLLCFRISVKGTK